MTDSVEQALYRGRGVFSAEEVRRGELARARASKSIVRLFPGVYVAADRRKDLLTRARALAKHDPTAVIVGRAAAALTWWRGQNVATIEAVRVAGCPPVPGFAWKQRRLPDQHVLRADGLVLTDAALTVLDLIPTYEGKVIDEALRLRAVTLDGLRAALAATPSRPGNLLRAQLIHDSRDAPWSESERGFHTIVRRLALPWSYETNHRVRAGTSVAYVDLAFPGLKLIFEVDGYPFHSDPGAFYRDRYRDLELSAAGWEVHRVASDLIGLEPAFLGRCVRDIADRRATARAEKP